MTGLNSWLSPAVMHALGWALIHSLWQCAAVAGLAALAMAFVRRPHFRYLVGVGALALMLAAPLATFLVLAKPAAPVPALPPASVALLPALSTAYPVAAFAGADRAIGAIREAPRPLALADILPWLVSAWLCGVALFSLRFAGGFLLLEHRRRTQSHVPGERVLALCLDLQRRLGLDRAIQYLECGWVEAPAVIGWLRPAVLLPVFALTGLSEEQFKAVIAHELAHIRRHDWFVNLFQVLVETLLFYHPAMWWLNRRIRIERELCCDEIAVSLTGSRLEYARALARMAEWKNVSLLAMAANRGPLTQRILHILGRKPSGAGQRVAGLTGGVLFLTAALAAANLLFGIAYPIPAKAEIRAVLVSSQSAALRMARQVFPVSEPAKIAAPQIAAPDKGEAASGSQTENLTVPSPDLSGLLPNQSLATPTVVVSNARSSVQVPADAASSNGQAKVIHCGNTSVFGRVLSPNAVEMQGFYCVLNGEIGASNSAIQSGSCPLASSYSYPGDPPGPFARDPSRTYLGDMVGPLNRLKEKGTECPFDIQMNVRLSDPADAAKMKPGRMVRLAGNFQITRQDNTDYLSVTDARVTWADPFNRQAAASDPAKVFHCLNTSVFGRVVSPDLIETRGFACNLNSPPIMFGACPWASSYSYPGDPSATHVGNPSRANIGAPVGRLKTPPPECKFDTQMNVRLADQADAARMQPGKVVRLAGEFRVTRQNNADYLSVAGARITWTDPFDRHAANVSPAVALNDQPGIQPPTRDQSAGPAQAPLSPPPSVMAAPMAGLSPAVTGTEPALACLLGLSYWLCQDDFFAGRAKRSFPRGVPDCVDERHPNAWPKHPASDSRCPHGVLEAVDYLGKNARGDDVYKVQYSHSATTYVLQQPNPDGKVEEYWNANIPSYKMAVPSQNAHKVTLYRRPAQWSDPSDRHAVNAPPTTPVRPPANPQPVVAPNNQPVASLIARDPTIGPVQTALDPSLSPKFNANEPYKTTRCTGTVMGRVISSTTIQIPKIACGGFSGGFAAPGGGVDGVGGGGGIFFDLGPCKRPRTAWGAEANVSGPLPSCPNKPWFTMTVQLANPADASKMPLGKLVTLKGDFLLITQNKVQYLLVQNARVLYVDPFDRQAAANAPAKIFHCHNTSAFGRVLSPDVIEMQGFICSLTASDAHDAIIAPTIQFGSCPAASSYQSAPQDQCKFDVTMNVRLADSADAAKMQPGKMVRVAGEFQVTRGNNPDYLFVTDARITWTDPFDRHAEADRLQQVPPAAPNGEPAAFTPHTVQAPSVFASNASTTAPAAGPQTITPCHNRSVFGRVMSPTAIEMQGFACFTDVNGNGSSLGPRDIALGGCPLASTTDAHKAGCVWDVTLNVRLADKGDAAKMQPGKLVRLGGNFSVVRKGQAPYLVLEHGKVLFVDFFWTGKSLPAADIPPFYMSVQGPSMPAGNSASGDPIGQIHGIGN